MGEDRKEDRHGWKKNDSKIIRIDHSDVYIENERLGEDLEYKMDNIHRSRYRQFLHRDSEISEIRKSLAKLRRESSKDSVLYSRGSAGHRGTRTNVNGTTKAVFHAAKTKDADRKETLGQPRNSPAPVAVQRVKNISIKIPDSVEDVEDSDLSSNDDDDDDDDDYDDIKLDSDDGDDVFDDAKNPSRSESRRAKTPKKERKPSPSPRSRLFDDPYVASKRPPSLKKLKKILKLDAIPQAWYTTAIPASDISFSKRAGRSLLWELTNPSNNPHVHSWKQPRPGHGWMSRFHKPNKPATERQRGPRSDNFTIRPHTSLGVSHAPDDDQTTTTPRATSSRPRGRPARPMTAMGYLSPRRQGAPPTKTVRQLKEMAEQEEEILYSRERTGVELLLDETRERKKELDIRIGLFLRSLDDLQKAKRWKEQGLNVGPTQSTLVSNSATFPIVNGRLFTSSVDKTSAWRSAVNVKRPTTVS